LLNLKQELPIHANKTELETGAGAFEMGVVRTDMEAGVDRTTSGEYGRRLSGGGNVSVSAHGSGTRSGESGQGDIREVARV
jgi:hypothetical protein